MKIRKNIWVKVLSLITPVILLSAVWVYINQLSRATEFSVIAFMNELSRRGQRTLV